MTNKEDPNTCYQCPLELTDSSGCLEFTCNHKLCPNCFSNYSISTGLKDISSKETLTIACPCENGQLEISLEDLITILSVDSSGDNEICEKHSETYDSYCTECKLWLCPQCKNLFHNEYFKEHKLVSAKPKEKNKCVYHNTQETTQFCLDCNIEICNLCMFNNGAHYNHNCAPINEYVNEFLKEKEKMEYNSYEKFSNAIQDKTTNLTKDVEEEIERTTKLFDELSEYIEKIKETYTNKMNEQLEISKQMLECVLLIFKHFYDEIENTPNPQNIKYYKDFNSKFKEIKVFSNSNNDIITSLKNAFTTIQDTTHPPNIESFSYKLNFIDDNTSIAAQTLIGHKSSVVSLVELQDKKIITGGGSGDNSLKLWDLIDLKCKHTLKGFSWGLMAVIQLKDGRICTGAGDNCISFWEKETFTNLGDITCHSDHIRSLFEMNEGDKVMSCGDDTTIKICDTKELKILYSLSGHTKAVMRAIQLKDGRIASCSKDKTIKLWDAKTLKCYIVMKGHSSGVNYISELQNGKIVSCSDDKTIRIWDTTNGDCNYTFNKHTAPVYQVIQIKDGRLASCSKDGSIKVWDLTRKKNGVSTINGHRDAVYCVMQLSNGNLMSGSRDQTVKIWDISAI